MRRFRIDPKDAEEVTEQDEPEAPTLRRRPSDKRWRRPHSDKTSRPVIGASPQGDIPDGIGD